MHPETNKSSVLCENLCISVQCINSHQTDVKSSIIAVFYIAKIKVKWHGVIKRVKDKCLLNVSYTEANTTFKI